jgi:hypothetical protein
MESGEERRALLSMILAARTGKREGIAPSFPNPYLPLLNFAFIIQH